MLKKESKLGFCFEIFPSSRASEEWHISTKSVGSFGLLSLHYMLQKFSF